jgi:hypothetical protein
MLARQNPWDIWPGAIPSTCTMSWHWLLHASLMVVLLDECHSSCLDSTVASRAVANACSRDPDDDEENAHLLR